MKEANYGLFSNLLNRYISAVPSCPEDYASHKRDLILPIVPVDILEKLCTDAERTFASEPIVLNVSSPVVIVGDLHGQILDLYRILLKYGLPDKRQYLFLGDIVD